MSFTLEKVVPWGRSFKEYKAMFSLTDGDLNKHILGCGDGPASFNAELTRQGGNIISVDPVYQFSAEEIKKRIATIYDEVINQTLQNYHEFVWEQFRTVDELGKIRIEAMNRFLKDYSLDVERKRYIKAELPFIPFQDKKFDLALCSHFLFLYSEHFSLEFHIQSVIELCRVAAEVIIFPLLELGANKSRYIDAVCIYLEENGYKSSIEKVSYEFQKGGNEMLRIMPSEYDE